MAQRDDDHPPGDDVLLDFDRTARIGLDEAVYAAGKTTGQLVQILTLVSERRDRILLTRLSPQQHASLPTSLQGDLDYCPSSQTARFGCPIAPTLPARIAIVCAGTSDVGVAREAERTLTYQGVASSWFADVGVAGLWRLTSRIDAIARHAVVIAVAGMDGALPTVLGGLVGSAVIAVPTSVGYGVAAGGHAALNAVLASCASGIVVVNIDNGYGAASAALRILRQLDAVSPPTARHASGSAHPTGPTHASPGHLSLP